MSNSELGDGEEKVFDMKKTSIFMITLMIVAFGISSCYDDSGLQSQVDDLDTRVKSLETLTAQMNTNISSIQTAVTALQNNDFVTNITEIKQGDDVIGYTINFSKSGAITIYHGEDGHTPKIGVVVYDDGLHYWTLDGNWLTDANGNKVRAEGIDGKDAIAPQIKIENEYWYISTDNGATWTQWGKATGEKGDSFFESVYQDDDNVYLLLTNGTLFTFSKEKPLSILFDESVNIAMTAGESKTIGYTIVGTTSNTIVKALGQNGWSAKVATTGWNNETGTITVTAPDPLTEDEILVWVYDGETKTIMSSLNFIKGTITVASGAYSLPQQATTQQVTVNTNIDYVVEIPKEAQSWLSLATTRSAMRKETLTFSLSENVGFIRHATVSIKNNAGKTLQTIAFEQIGNPLTLHVAIPGTLKALIPEGQKNTTKTMVVTGTINNSDFLTIKEMSQLEVLDISEITNTSMPIRFFKDNKIIREVRLPKQLSAITEEFFASSSIVTCEIPESVTEIGNSAFYKCYGLAGKLILPEGLITIGMWAFRYCSRITGELLLPEGLTTIGHSAFEGCTGFTGELVIPEGLTRIESTAFNGCAGFTGELVLPEGLTTIGNAAFAGCTGFTGDIILPQTLTSFGGSAFMGCTGIEKLYSKNNTPPYAFGDIGFNYLGVPIGAKTVYKSTRYWKDIIVIEEVDFDALNL